MRILLSVCFVFVFHASLICIACLAGQLTSCIRVCLYNCFNLLFVYKLKYFTKIKVIYALLKVCMDIK